MSQMLKKHNIIPPEHLNNRSRCFVVQKNELQGFRQDITIILASISDANKASIFLLVIFNHKRYIAIQPLYITLRTPQPARLIHDNLS